MADPARKVAQKAEDRLNEVADTVREKFDRITESRFVGLPGRGTDRGGGEGRQESRGGDRPSGREGDDRPKNPERRGNSPA